MSITCLEILNKLPNIYSEIHGDSKTQVSDIVSPESGIPGTMVFVSNEKHLENAIRSNASAMVVTPTLFKKAIDLKCNKTLLVAKNVPYAWAITTQTFFPFDPRLDHREHNIHPSAIIGKNCNIDPTAVIDAHAVVGDHVTVGKNTWIGANTTIQNFSKIGQNTKIFPGVFLGQGCQVGDGCEIKPNSTIGSEGFGFAQDQKGHHHRIPQRGIVVLEDHVSIGANCTIDRGTFKETRIKEGTKIDNLVHVGHNCTIGRHGLFVSGIVFAGSTTVGDHNVYGGHVSVSGHLKITDHVHLGARAGVTKSIETPGAYGGYPVQPLKEHFRTAASVANLPKLRKQLQKILKHLGIHDSGVE